MQICVGADRAAFRPRLKMGLAALAGLLAIGAGCKKPAPPAPPPPTVTVAHPIEERLVEWNEYSGRLTAVEAVEVRPRVSGYIESIHFTEGQEVNEGDLLFVIDKRPFLAEVARAKAQLSQAKAAQSLARANLERARKLVSSQAISKEEADIRTSEALQADADVERAMAELEAAALQLDFTDVRAPIAGIASRFYVTKGNVVQGGSGEGTLLTTIVPHDPIYVYFETDEAAVLSGIRRFFAGRQPGRGEKGSRPVEMQLADEKGFPHRGEIDFFDNQLNPDTNTMLVRGKFANKDRFFTPGMFARVRVPAGGEQQVILVPQEAIGADLTARYVWVLKPDNTVERRSIDPGTRHGSLRVVRGGLGTDDLVVITGTQFLRPGAKVTPKEEEISRPRKEPAEGEGDGASAEPQPGA